MRIWTEQPAEADVEAVVRRYFGLLRAGRVSEAEQLIDHHPVRHVLKSLWAGYVEASRGSGADEWERDLSWLGELDLAEFRWGDTGSHVYVGITCRARPIEVALGFWVKPVEAGWVLAGPSTLW
ncbi:hypothetical protein ABZ896_46960 [Streptomyces sp. NPDC047072]|uniref:hypothetical protein n=1 Tax=Streptomyces sp. NPDC047072 TaxID=3154809 RepID=UPI0033D553F7